MTPYLLTIGGGSHDLSELDRVYTLPYRTGRGSSTRVLSRLVLVDGTVDRKVQRKDVIIHGEFKMPIGSLVLQSGRIRDFGLGRALLRAR